MVNAEGKQELRERVCGERRLDRVRDRKKEINRIGRKTKEGKGDNAVTLERREDCGEENGENL